MRGRYSPPPGADRITRVGPHTFGAFDLSTPAAEHFLASVFAGRWGLPPQVVYTDLPYNQTILTRFEGWAGRKSGARIAALYARVIRFCLPAPELYFETGTGMLQALLDLLSVTDKPIFGPYQITYARGKKVAWLVKAGSGYGSKGFSGMDDSDKIGRAHV